MTHHAELRSKSTARTEIGKAASTLPPRRGFESTALPSSATSHRLADISTTSPDLGTTAPARAGGNPPIQRTRGTEGSKKKTKKSGRSLDEVIAEDRARLGGGVAPPPVDMTTFEYKFNHGLVSLKGGDIEELHTTFDRDGGYSTKHMFTDSDDNDAFEVHVHRNREGHALIGNVKSPRLARVAGGRLATIQPRYLEAYGIPRIHRKTGD